MIQVCCPVGDCRSVFEIADHRLGRNICCLDCGHRFTAVHHEGQAGEQGQKDVLRRLQPAIETPRFPFRVLLENIRSLWNVGSIFRTADGCGVQQIYLTGITGTPPRSEISKTALGAEDFVGWQYSNDALKALEEARSAGYIPVALEKSHRSIPLLQMDWPSRLCLILGNEAVGISSPLLESCQTHVHLPMCGTKNSFNVAVAFGIAAHAVALQMNPRHPDVPMK